MTQYVYLVQRHPDQRRDEPVEVLGEVVEPKSDHVLDFLDALAEELGSGDDGDVRLADVAGARVMQGRVVMGEEIAPSAVRAAFERSPGAGAAVSRLLDRIAKRPEELFDASRGRGDWDTFKELWALRTMVLQARAKKGRAIAICHD